jgi:hypothetical protein
MTSKTSDTEVEKTQKGVEPKVNVDDEPVWSKIAKQQFSELKKLK